MSVFKNIVQGIGAVAPTVANLVVPGSGPLLDGLMRAVTGDGPETPIEEVAAKIQADPKLYVELQTVAAQKEVQLAEIALKKEQVRAQRLATVNATMQAEGKSEHWPQYSWRPAIGFSVAVAFLESATFVFVLAYRAIVEKDPSAIGMIPTLITALTGLFAVPMAILGVAVWDRGKEKRAKAGDTSVESGGLVELVGALRGKAGGG